MAISINIHRIVLAESHTCDVINSHSYVQVQDNKGGELTFYIPDGPLHEKRAAYLTEGFKLAFLIETEDEIKEEQDRAWTRGHV
jgi:hypothetical protein